MADFEQNLNPTETDTTLDSLFPQPTGHYAVGTTSYHFVDSEREETYTEDENDNREITAKVWYPSQDIADASPEPYLNQELRDLRKNKIPAKQSIFSSIVQNSIGTLLRRKSLSSAVATELEIPAEDLLNVTQFLTTNSITDAPLAEDKSKYPVLVYSHGDILWAVQLRPKF